MSHLKKLTDACDSINANRFSRTDLSPTEGHLDSGGTITRGDAKPDSDCEKSGSSNTEGPKKVQICSGTKNSLSAAHTSPNRRNKVPAKFIFHKIDTRMRVPFDLFTLPRTATAPFGPGRNSSISPFTSPSKSSSDPSSISSVVKSHKPTIGSSNSRPEPARSHSVRTRTRFNGRLRRSSPPWRLPTADLSKPLLPRQAKLSAAAALESTFEKRPSIHRRPSANKPNGSTPIKRSKPKMPESDEDTD